MAKNVTMTVQGNKLIVEIDLTKEYGLSSSGKSTILASSEGNLTIPGHDGTKLGINVFRVGR